MHLLSFIHQRRSKAKRKAHSSSSRQLKARGVSHQLSSLTFCILRSLHTYPARCRHSRLLLIRKGNVSFVGCFVCAARCFLLVLSSRTTHPTLASLQRPRHPALPPSSPHWGLSRLPCQTFHGSRFSKVKFSAPRCTTCQEYTAAALAQHDRQTDVNSKNKAHIRVSKIVTACIINLCSPCPCLSAVASLLSGLHVSCVVSAYVGGDLCTYPSTGRNRLPTYCSVLSRLPMYSKHASKHTREANPTQTFIPSRPSYPSSCRFFSAKTGGLMQCEPLTRCRGQSTYHFFSKKELQQ